MQDFLKGVKNLGAKAKSTLKDLFTLTEEEKKKGKTPNALEKTTQTVGDFFAPAPNKVRVRDVVREVPGATADVAKEIGKGFARFGLSAGESLVDVPLGINELINPGTKLKVPIYEPEKIPGLGFLGPIESYQNQAKREMSKGESGGVKSFLKAGGNIAIDEPLGVALKPLGIGFGAFMRSGGGKALSEGVQAGLKAIESLGAKFDTKIPGTLFHGTTAKNAESILKDGWDVGKNTKGFAESPYAIFASENGGKGSDHAAGTYGDTILNLVPKKGEKIRALGPEGWAETAGKSTGTQDSEILYGTLKEKGYDAVLDSSGEWVILSPEKFEFKALDNVAPKAGKGAQEAVSRETAQEVPKVSKPAEETVARETPKGTGTMRSIGEIMQDGGKGVVPPEVRVSKGKAPKGEPERHFITRTREMAPEMDTLLKGKYTPKSNKELVANAEKLIKEDYLKAENMARTGTDDQAVAVASRMIEDELAIAKKATDEATKNKAYAKAAEIANDAARNLTEAGRTVQAASLLGKMTPEGMARYAARKIQQYNEQAGARTVRNFLGGAKKIPELTPDQLKEITDGMEAINKMAEGIEKARALDKLGKTIQGYIPSSIYAKILGVWKAGLLTGLKTTGINIASNLSHAISEVVKDVPGSMVDIVVQKLFTGKRALVSPLSRTQAKQTYKGVGEGLQKGWDYLKTGFDERNVAAKLDYKRVNYGKTKVGKVIQGYVDTVFGLLGAEDQAFYYAARARSLGNQAEAMAINEGLKGKAARDFAQKLIENPTDDMLKYSVVDAETAVFQHDSAIARAANKAKQALSEVVIPFAKTPGNVADQMLNYTPYGIVKTIVENIGKGRFDQRLFSQGMGRGITGTGALAIGSALMANKLMNLSTPTSEKEREQWELEGRIPNSVKIGGKWRNVGVLGPLGMVLIIGGHYQKGLEESGSHSGALARSGAGALNALTEQSFLTGINRFVEALKDPARSMEGFVSSLGGSLVPTLIADLARGTDQYERRTTGIPQRIQSRIPGARQGLEPKIDAFGQPVETPNFFEVMADATRPGNPTADPKDPVLVELRRLMDADYPVTPTQLGPNAGYKSLTPEQNSFLWKLAGQASKSEIERVMNTRQYKNYDDEQKSQVIDAAIQDAKTEARARAVVQALKGLSESEQKSKLAEMKEDGLLTRSVFDLYLSLKRKQ